MDLPPRMPPPAPPMGTPSNSPTENVVGNVAAIGTAAAYHGGFAAANTAAGIGTGDALSVSQVQFFFADRIKHHPHFDEQAWLDPIMAVVGVPVAFVLGGHLGVGSLIEGVLALVKSIVVSLEGAKLAKVEYHAAQSTVAAGIIKPVSPENEYAQNAHPWPAPNSPGWGMTQVAQEPKPITVGDVLP